MLNLLTTEEKEVIKREYRIRLSIVIAWFILATLVIAFVLLVPSFVVVSQKEKVLEEQIKLLSQNIETKNAAEQNKILQETDSLLPLFKKGEPKIYLYDLLVKTVSLKSTFVSITSISFSEAGDKKSIHIAGMAQNRNALVGYVKALEKSGLFEAVEIPISNYAKDADIEFSFRAVPVLK